LQLLGRHINVSQQKRRANIFVVSGMIFSFGLFVVITVEIIFSWWRFPLYYKMIDVIAICVVSVGSLLTYSAAPGYLYVVCMMLQSDMEKVISSVDTLGEKEFELDIHELCDIYMRANENLTNFSKTFERMNLMAIFVSVF
jgi:hypothetical protein